MKTSIRIIMFLLLSSPFGSWVWAEDARFFCQELSTTIIDFSPGTLPFPDGTNITDQFRGKGVIFSADDSDLPPEFQRSLGSQENRIMQGTFTNLFRLNFTHLNPIISVSVTFRDQNGNRQVHTLTAFDSAGNVVDRAWFSENTVFPDTFPDWFTLTVSSCKGIAFIVAYQEPLGAQSIKRITFTKGRNRGLIY